MRVAVVLSGSVRFNYKSLASLAVLRDAGHDVDVYVHSWCDIKAFQGDSWSWHYQPDDATDEIIAQYAPVKHVIESWLSVRQEIVDQVESWKRWTALKHFTHYGMPGMWRSLQSSYNLIPNTLAYDGFLRLRFDSGLSGDPFVYNERGWNVPDTHDFGGLCDQLAWYNCGGAPSDENALRAYFGVYDRLTKIFDAGVNFHPEGVLLKSMEMGGQVPHRPRFHFTIHDD